MEIKDKHNVIDMIDIFTMTDISHPSPEWDKTYLRGYFKKNLKFKTYFLFYHLNKLIR